MSGVLLFLGFSAELAHIDCLVEVGTARHLTAHTPEESSSTQGSFVALCSACIFHSTHLATPQVGMSAIRFTPAGMILDVSAPLDYQNLTSHCSLRAPPFTA